VWVGVYRQAVLSEFHVIVSAANAKPFKAKVVTGGVPEGLNRLSP
jgi:hypothetical protein